MITHQHSDILHLYLLLVCVAQHRLPACEVKVTLDLCLKLREWSKPANAWKSTKDVYLNQRLRIERYGELLQQGRSILTFLYQCFHDIFCLLHHSLSRLPWQRGWLSLSFANKAWQREKKPLLIFGWDWNMQLAVLGRGLAVNFAGTASSMRQICRGAKHFLNRAQTR